MRNVLRGVFFFVLKTPHTSSYLLALFLPFLAKSLHSSGSSFCFLSPPPLNHSMGCVSAKEKTSPAPQQHSSDQHGHDYRAIKEGGGGSSNSHAHSSSVAAVNRGPQSAPASGAGSRRGSGAGPRAAADTEERNTANQSAVASYPPPPAASSQTIIEEDDGEEEEGYVPPKRKVSKLVRRGQQPQPQPPSASEGEGDDEALVLVCADCGAEILRHDTMAKCPVSGKHHV